MAPTISTGALALTAPVSPEQIRVGDVVSAPRPRDGALVTHRVTSVERDAGTGRWLVRMQGDANPVEDAQAYDVTDGARRTFWHVDGLGRVVAALDSGWILGAAAALVVIALWPRDTRRQRSRTERGVTDVCAAGRLGEAID